MCGENESESYLAFAEYVAALWRGGVGWGQMAVGETKGKGYLIEVFKFNSISHERVNMSSRSYHDKGRKSYSDEVTCNLVSG